MIPLPLFQSQTVAILGLGRSGLATASAVRHAGGTPLCWDDNAQTRSRAQEKGFTVTPLNDIAWEDVSALVLSPGIPHTYPAPHPVVAKAKSKGVALISDINCFFASAPKGPVIGVTGTNGKSTTSTLIAHLLRTVGETVALGGNIGIPVLELPPLDTGSYVLELSSYQLELTPDLDLDVALLLNLSPDHLERHGGLDGYVKAKKRIFENRSKPLQAVMSVDDPLSAQLFDALQATGPHQTLLPISTLHPLDRGVYVKDGVLMEYAGGGLQFAGSLGHIPTLKGIHNHANAAASYAALRLLGYSSEAIFKGFTTFPGLAHRQEWIGTFEGITYINDSKATNAAATLTALQAYRDHTLYCIFGGRPKEGGLMPLQSELRHLNHAFLIGEAAPEFHVFCALSQLPATQSHTLSQALADATQRAQADKKPNPVILLSPACASFDQFRDFEERGEAFRAWVKERFHGHPSL